MSNVKLIVTDLDNTLYDWVTYFSASFYSMLGDLSRLIKVDQEILIAEFKVVHQYYENTEQPFSLLELPSVRKAFPDLTKEELVQALESPLSAFNKKRTETLVLYPGVEYALRKLQERNIIIIGHTESVVDNSIKRLTKLGIKKYFKHLYTLEGKGEMHPSPGTIKEPTLLEDGFTIIVPKADRKPNPRLLLDICAKENVDKSQVAYVGDSLTRDISMANEAGVLSFWAKYGKSFSDGAWNDLVKITHWTQEDVDREALLRNKYHGVKPNYTIDKFSEILEILK